MFTDGIPGIELTDEELSRELEQLHETRHDVFLHGSEHALHHHTDRLDELELEYLRRHPEREIRPERLRAGARLRDGQMP